MCVNIISWPSSQSSSPISFQRRYHHWPLTRENGGGPRVGQNWQLGKMAGICTSQFCQNIEEKMFSWSIKDVFDWSASRPKSINQRLRKPKRKFKRINQRPTEEKYILGKHRQKCSPFNNDNQIDRQPKLLPLALSDSSLDGKCSRYSHIIVIILIMIIFIVIIITLSILCNLRKIHTPDLLHYQIFIQILSFIRFNNLHIWFFPDTLVIYYILNRSCFSRYSCQLFQMNLLLPEQDFWWVRF